MARMADESWQTTFAELMRVQRELWATSPVEATPPPPQSRTAPPECHWGTVFAELQRVQRELMELQRRKESYDLIFIARQHRDVLQARLDSKGLEEAPAD